MMTQVKVSNLFDDLDRMFSALISNAPDHYPVTNIYVQDESDLVFEFAVTGFKRDQVNISISDGILIVTGNKQDEYDDKRKFISRKIACRSFTKKYVIPQGFDNSKVDAIMEDGLLTVRMQRKQEDVRLVEIR